MSKRKKKTKTSDELLDYIDTVIESDDDLDETVSSEELAKQISEALDEFGTDSDSKDLEVENRLANNSDDSINSDKISDEEKTSIDDVSSYLDKQLNNNLDETISSEALTKQIRDSLAEIGNETSSSISDVKKQENDNLESTVKPEEVSKQIDINNRLNANNDYFSNNSKYISYEHRVIKVAAILLISFGLTLFFILKSFSMTNADSISYNEKSNLDYKVYLKENNFYETDYLGKDMLYVANLIDHINVDFDYNFDINKMVDLDLTYDIVAKLRITDNSEKSLFFEKEYVLQEPITEKIGNSSSHNIKKSIDIDYNYYNSLANNFRTSYGLDTKSNLLVYFRVKQDNGKYEVKYPIQGSSEMLINIPLSEKAISVKMDYKEVNENKKVLASEHLAVTNYFFVLLAIICFDVMVYYTVKLVRLIKYVLVKKSNYDKYVSRVLKEYDRLIVETETAPVINNSINVIKVSKFQELLDVRDNLKLPIKYYVVNKHQKCYFFISHGDELYLLTVKEVDLEGENKEK